MKIGGQQKEREGGNDGEGEQGELEEWRDGWTTEREEGEGG